MAGGPLYTDEQNDTLLTHGVDGYLAEQARFGWPSRSRLTLKRHLQTLRSEGVMPDPFRVLDAPIPPRFERTAEPSDLWDYLERAHDVRKEREEPAITLDVDLGHKPVGLAFLSDVHIGGGGVDLRRFRTDLERLSRAEGVHAILNGDLWENTKTQSKSAPALYSASFANPQEQYDYARDRLQICLDRWLVVASGNHDAFDYRHAGVDRLAALCKELDLPYASERGCTIRCRVGHQTYIVVAKHDYKGKSQLNKSNSQRRLWDEWPHEWENADIVALAHLHEPLHEVVQRKGRDVVYLRSGTYKINDAWAEAGGYKPNYGVGFVILWPDQRKLLPWVAADWHDGLEYLAQIRQ